MNLTRQRHLCETMGYNTSEPFAPTRARIKRCRLIFGTGDADECRRAVQNYVMDIELPCSGEAIQAGFGTPRSVGIQIEDSLSNAAVISSYLYKFRAIVQRMVPTEIQRNQYDDYIVPLSALEHATNLACNVKLGEPSAVFTENHMCFPSKFHFAFLFFYSLSSVSFLVELLYAFGSKSSTTATLISPANILLGTHLGIESDPHYLHDFISIGALHWRDQTHRILHETFMHVSE